MGDLVFSVTSLAYLTTYWKLRVQLEILYCKSCYWNQFKVKQSDTLALEIDLRIIMKSLCILLTHGVHENYQ